MLQGLPPFYAENTNEMYQKITEEPLSFNSKQKRPSNERPDTSDFAQEGSPFPTESRRLLKLLLNRDGEARLGARGSEEIKAHEFFKHIDWRKLLARKYEPLFKPNVVSSRIRLFCGRCSFWGLLNGQHVLKKPSSDFFSAANKVFPQADQLDTANFDAEFTSEAPMDSYVEGPVLSQTMQQQFQGWSYMRPVEGLGDGEKQSSFP